MNIVWSLAVRDAAVLAIGACGFLAGMLRFNPRLFLAHYPEVLRKVAPPKTASEKRQSVIGAIILFAWTIGVLAASAIGAESRGTDDFTGLALHTFFVGMLFNLADWLILDELWLGLVRPRWLIPAGIDPTTIPFEHARHFRGFLRGSLLFALIGAFIAACVRFL
jgi:hypothetical protein